MTDLKSLVVLQKLSVGDIRVEVEKVHAEESVPYFLGKTASCESASSYDAPCFHARI